MKFTTYFGLLVLLAFVAICQGSDSCEAPSIRQTCTYSWAIGGVYYSLWNVEILNVGSTTLFNVYLDFPSYSYSLISQIWDLDVYSTGYYQLPPWISASGIIPGGFHSFGYISYSTTALEIFVTHGGYSCSPAPMDGGSSEDSSSSSSSEESSSEASSSEDSSSDSYSKHSSSDD